MQKLIQQFEWIDEMKMDVQVDATTELNETVYYNKCVAIRHNLQQ